MTNSNGCIVCFQASVLSMDDDLRERLHNDIAPCTDQEFFAAYMAEHAREFGEEWEWDKLNPMI